MRESTTYVTACSNLIIHPSLLLTHMHTHAVQEAEEHISAEEMAEVMLKHTEEMRKLQQEYE